MNSPISENLLRIINKNDVKEGRFHKFIIQRSDRETEAFIFKKNGRFFAYLNLCRHWLIGLDFDDNEFFSEDGQWLICKTHGAVYHPTTGQCEGGPCGSASLYRVPLVEKEEAIFADLEKIDWGEEI